MDQEVSPFSAEVRMLQNELAELNAAFERKLSKVIVRPDFVLVNVIGHTLSKRGDLRNLQV